MSLEHQNGLPETVVWAVVIGVFYFWLIPFISSIGKYDPPTKSDAVEESVAGWVDSWIEW